jgi:phospholipase C
VLDDGLGNDDHPHADLRNGEIFLRDLVTRLASSSLWANTVIVINRDEWGGFFDHVAPPRAAAPNSVDTDIVHGKSLLGCRVPTIIVSPFARGNPSSPVINSLVYDHTSVLKLIEWRWGLAPLTARDASDDVANLASALNFSSPDTSVPSLPTVSKPSVDSCTFEDLLHSIEHDTSLDDVEAEAYDFFKLLESDLVNGWKVLTNS